MDIRLSAAQREWVAEVREFLDEAFGPGEIAEVRRWGREGRHAKIRAFRGKMAKRGWLALTWPPEVGGLGRTTVEQVLLMDEFAYRGAPPIDMTAHSVAPTILRCGTPEEQARWLPGIRNGDVEFAIGYSEPEAGSDLANLSTSARLDGDHWVINGEKIWNTGAEYASHEWLACRTDPGLPRHRGISLFTVPMDTPGISIDQLPTWLGPNTNIVRFSGVRVPADSLFGERGAGWRYLVTALDFERVAIGVTGELRRLIDELVTAVGTDPPPGSPGNAALIRRDLAELIVQLDLARLLNYRAAWMIDQGLVPAAEASMTKIRTTELYARLSDTAMRLLGPAGTLSMSGPLARAGELAQRMYRTSPYLRFGGGTNEIQRDIIAQLGYGLPRS